MNYKDRRRFNKMHKTNYTKRDFDIMEAYTRIVHGNYSLEDVLLVRDVINIDNEELVPEGTPVKLYYEAITSRPRKNCSEKFLNWVEEHKDMVFHVTREQASQSLVCLKEDVGYIKENPQDDERDIGHVPWLFSIYDDFLYCIPNTDKWVTLGEYQKEVKKA